MIFQFLKKKEQNAVFFQDCLVESCKDFDVSLYASCWIYFRSEELSADLVQFYIQQENFKIKEIVFPIKRVYLSDYTSKYKNLRQYHNEALNIGYSLLFHPDKLIDPFL